MLTVTDGLVQPISVGRSVIIASTCDGSNISAYCIAEVTEDAGVLEVNVDDSISLEVANGTIQVKGAKATSRLTLSNISGQVFYIGHDHKVENLSSGLYIVNIEGRTFKVAL